MPLQKVSVTLAKNQGARSADLIVIPFTKGPFKASSALVGISPTAASLMQGILKKKKINQHSSSFSIEAPRSVRKNDLISIAVLPTDYAEKTDSFERLQRLRALGTACAEQGKRSKARSVAFDTTPLKGLSVDEQAALLEGLFLSLYTFDNYRSKAKTSALKTVLLVGGAVTREVLSKTSIVCEAVSLARDLVNTPARDCTPSMLKRTAAAISRSGRLAFKSYTSQSLTSMGADMLMSVFRSSNETPYLLTMTYKPRKPRKVIAIVGKGVTFDSGGLSIKSGSGMFDMKCDMAGAASVIAAMQAVARLKPDVEVRGYIPTTENMINRTSTRPGDVVKALNGKTVEILNTDAEGRLIIGDTLVLADRAKPDVIIDLATLTGAVIAALGSDYAGVFSPSDKLSDQLLHASALSGERMWRLPLPPEYKEKLKSTVADMRNIGGSEAGSITAALFLNEFVKTPEWAHIDIAGPAYSSTKGASGFGVRTLLAYLTSSH
jgi:leucyl aminopeptidase